MSFYKSHSLFEIYLTTLDGSSLQLACTLWRVVIGLHFSCNPCPRLLPHLFGMIVGVSISRQRFKISCGMLVKISYLPTQICIAKLSFKSYIALCVTQGWNTIFHALIVCPCAREIWSLASFYFPKPDVAISLPLWSSLSLRSSIVERVKVATICWAIWNYRNSFLWNTDH